MAQNLGLALAIKKKNMKKKAKDDAPQNFAEGGQVDKTFGNATPEQAQAKRDAWQKAWGSMSKGFNGQGKKEEPKRMADGGLVEEPMDTPKPFDSLDSESISALAAAIVSKMNPMEEEAHDDFLSAEGGGEMPMDMEEEDKPDTKGILSKIMGQMRQKHMGRG